MLETFDPYHKWLGITPKDQPPSHYRLLAIELFESDPDVISNAADKQMAHIRSFQTGKHSDLSQKILNEISAAKICLLNSEKKRTYDERLRSKMKPLLHIARPLEATPASPLPEAIPEFPDFESASAPTSRKKSVQKKPKQFPWVVAAGVVAVLAFAGFVTFSMGPRHDPPKSTTETAAPICSCV